MLQRFFYLHRPVGNGCDCASGFDIYGIIEHITIVLINKMEFIPDFLSSSQGKIQLRPANACSLPKRGIILFQRDSMLIAQAIFADAPRKVSILVVDLAPLPGRFEGEVALFSEIDGNTIVCKAQLIRPLHLNFGLANDLAAGLQTDFDLVAGTGSRVKAVCINVAIAGENRPGSTCGDIRLAASGVNAGRRKLHRAAGGIDLVIGRHHRVVELTRGLRRGEHHDGVGHLTLVAVGRTAAQGQTGGAAFRLAFALGGEGRGAAAIQIDGLHAAQIFHGGRNLCHGHADRIGCLTAIHHEHHHRAVSLDADGSAGSTGRIVKIAAGVAVHKDIAKAGDSFQNIACRKGGAAFLCAGDVRVAARIDPEGRIGRRIDLRAAHDKRAAWATVAHVIAAGVDRADNIGCATGLHALRLLGRFRHGPVSAGFDGFDIIITVTGRNGSCGAFAHFDLHHMTHHLLGQCAIVQDPFVFLDIGCHGIFLFGYLPDTQSVKSAATCVLRCLNLCR